jgi:hypothetical protein
MFLCAFLSFRYPVFKVQFRYRSSRQEKYLITFAKLAQPSIVGNLGNVMRLKEACFRIALSKLNSSVIPDTTLQADVDFQCPCGLP